MKHRTKHLILIIFSFVVIGKTNIGLSDTTTDTETLLNWVENTYPDFFPSRQATQEIEPWLFRHYPESGVYAGVNRNDNGVYVLGGIWGNNPTLIAQLPDLISQIENLGGNGNIAACDTTSVTEGITYSQSGNIVSVTSKGQCQPAPDLNNSNLCQIPQQATTSGISILSSNTVTSSRLEGIIVDNPGFPNPFQSIADSTANVRHCTINATAESVSVVVNTDLCFDITSEFTALFSDFSIDGVTITPPIQYFFTGTYTSQVVDDCFATDATTVRDAVTGDTWINQSGSFVKLNN